MCTNERRQLANRERDRPWVFLVIKKAKRIEENAEGKRKKEIKTKLKEQKKNVAFII